MGASDDGPGDAAVIVPVRGSSRGLAVGCGINPRYGQARSVCNGRLRASTRPFATAWPSGPTQIESPCLTTSAGATPSGQETLGALVLAAEACHDVALAYGTPFISGKDSLNNEYTHDGKSQAIPPTLLISAMGQVPDVRQCVTMDLKEPGNVLLLLGLTRNELGGSLWCDFHSRQSGRVPRVDPALGKSCLKALHAAITRGLLRSCHDLSEGGLAVALAEMAFAGGTGARVSLSGVPRDQDASTDLVLLFSESPTRFVAGSAA